MFRTKMGFIETKARAVHGDSTLNVHFNEETDFVHVEHIKDIPKLSQTPLRELTKQVDLFEGKIGFCARQFLKPKPPQAVLTEVQSQLSTYEHVSEKDEHIPIHLAQLRDLDVRLRQRINFNQFVGNLLTKVGVFTKSLTSNIDPKNIPSGCTASLGKSQSFIQSEKLKTELKPVVPLLRPMQDLDSVIGEAEGLLDQMLSHPLI